MRVTLSQVIEHSISIPEVAMPAVTVDDILALPTLLAPDVTARAQGGLNPSRRATWSYASIKDAAWCSHTKSGARDTARR